MNWALEVANAARLSASERLVLLILAHHHHDKTSACFPAVDTIAGYAGLSTRRVQMTIRALTTSGLISVATRSVHGRQRTNQCDLFGRLRGEASVTPQRASRGDKKSTPQIDRGVKPASPNREEIPEGASSRTADLFTFPRQGRR